ncbi:MAG: class I SAM-dependent methyltransferase [Pseudomonadota bacterium]
MRPDIPEPFSKRPWLADALTVPEDALTVPTMLSDEESAFLYWLTRDYAIGAGAVIDLGCFVGGSTARLAAGVRDGGRDTLVHAYDRFTIQAEQKKRYLYPAGVRPFPGESMIGAVKELLRGWQDIVRLHPGEILEKTWNDRPIEILFIDAGKTPAAADWIAEQYMPHLIAGRSVVVQQDYQHWRQPWLAAQMHWMSDCFQPVARCGSGTVLFLCTRVPDKAALERGRVEGRSDGSFIGALEAVIGLTTDASLRRKMARAIMGVEDNPGIRVTFKMNKDAFSAKRANAIIARLK